MNAYMHNMKDERRNHGMCSLVRNFKMAILVGLGEDDNRDDNDKFEIYDLATNCWTRVLTKNPMKLCWPGFIQVDNDTVLIIGGWDNSSEIFNRVNHVYKITLSSGYSNTESEIQNISKVNSLNEINM